MRWSLPSEGPLGKMKQILSREHVPMSISHLPPPTVAPGELCWLCNSRAEQRV